MRQVRESITTLLQCESHAVQRLTHWETLPDEFAEHRQGNGPLFIPRRLDHDAKRRPIHTGLDRVRAGGELRSGGSTSLPAHRILCLGEPVRTTLDGMGDPIFRDALRSTLGDARIEQLARDPRLGSPRLCSLDPLRRRAGALCFRCYGCQRQQCECGCQYDVSLHADLRSGGLPASSHSTDKDGRTL
jgi:hypothetical protein